VWVGIIAGMAWGLSPALSGAVSIAGAVVGMTLVVAGGKRLQGWSTAAAGSPSAASA
jgi:membrane protein DedA with SNARE-associated domain